MSMSTGAKIAVGCAVVVVVTGVAALALVGGAAWWVKGKTEGLVAGENRIEELRTRANRNTFQAPADGLIQEDRLQRFLGVRKRVYAVYEKHQAELEALSKKDKGQLSDVTRGYGILTELRTAQAEAQADAGMSEDEYNFLVAQVYKTLWAAEMAQPSGGQQGGLEQAARAMEEAAKQTEGAQAEAMRKQADELRQRTREMEVPPANVELFRKHEAEIRKYAMSGLEWLGL